MAPLLTSPRFWIYLVIGAVGSILCLTGGRTTYYAAAFWAGYASGGIALSPGFSPAVARWLSAAAVALLLLSAALSYGPSNVDPGSRGLLAAFYAVFVFYYVRQCVAMWRGAR